MYFMDKELKVKEQYCFDKETCDLQELSTCLRRVEQPVGCADGEAGVDKFYLFCSVLFCSDLSATVEVTSDESTTQSNCLSGKTPESGKKI